MSESSSKNHGIDDDPFGYVSMPPKSVDVLRCGNCQSLRAEVERLKKEAICSECGTTDSVCAKGWLKDKQGLESQLAAMREVLKTITEDNFHTPICIETTERLYEHCECLNRYCHEILDASDLGLTIINKIKRLQRVAEAARSMLRRAEEIMGYKIKPSDPPALFQLDGIVEALAALQKGDLE